MSTNWQPDNAALRKERFWRTPPPNVTELARKNGSAHFNRVLHAVLMPQSAMPIGPHTGMLMERLPADYLAWVQAQPWTSRWHPWHPVADYLTRFPLPDTTSTDWPSHICTVSPMHACAPTQEWTHPEHALLRCHRDIWLHEDKYHTFALGALSLRPQWFDPKLQAYRLTTEKRSLAIHRGAGELASDQRRSTTFRRVDATGNSVCTKHCYPTKQDADNAAAERMKSRHNRPEHLRSYHCPDCSFHHLTHKPL
jgi:hypothetical protein